MACDGSPGNPGVERDGKGDKFACQGCARCRPSQFKRPRLRTYQDLIDTAGVDRAQSRYEKSMYRA